jgi:hypothetical protein
MMFFNYICIILELIISLCKSMLIEYVSTVILHQYFGFFFQPFLVDGYKFDLRVYVAVTSCDPFRVFVYKDGLARFTTQHYEEPSSSNCVSWLIELIVPEFFFFSSERYFYAFNQLCDSKTFGWFHSRWRYRY